MSATAIKKTALITGGSSGIGLAYAKYLLKKGGLFKLYPEMKIDH